MEPVAEPASAWAAEPQNLDELNRRHDRVMECPGRDANVQLVMVPSTEKNQTEGALVEPGQQHKLFLAPQLSIWIYFTV